MMIDKNRGARVVLTILVALLACCPAIKAQSLTTSVWMELHLPKGGSTGSELRLNRRVVSGSPVVSSSTDARGGSVRKTYLVSEFELLGTDQESATFRYRLKWFDGRDAVKDAARLLDEKKVSWHTAKCALGESVTMQADGGPAVVGSVAKR